MADVAGPSRRCNPGEGSVSTAGSGGRGQGEGSSVPGGLGRPEVWPTYSARNRSMSQARLRIALLTYRGNPRSGGQGIYVRLLSRALVELGHEVDVFSGPPYPELLDGTRLVEVPSLDLWADPSGRRAKPGLGALRDRADFAEWASAITGGFAEPITFCRRVSRRLKPNGAPVPYDIVHDNGSLGPGLLELGAHVPVVATIHHPITRDRRIAYGSTRKPIALYGYWRFYSAFLPSQIRVSRRLDRVLTVSEASRADLVSEYGVPAERMRVVGNGINVEVFRPLAGVDRVPDRIVATLSADAPLKGFRFLLEALAQVRRERPAAHLTVVGAPGAQADTPDRIRALGLEAAIRFTGKIEDHEIAQLHAEASVAVVPSLYEGFGFPAGEAMASEVPVVSTTGGALPEVVGTDGRCGILVEPGSAEALARGLLDLLGRPESRRREMGAAGRQRVLENFTWRRAAERTVEVYREAIARRALPC